MNNPLSNGRFSLFDRLFAYLKALRPGDGLTIKAISLLVITSGLISLYEFNQKYIVTVPTSGGVLIEGVIGSPRFVNPVLASTRADNDLVALTYSSLVKLSPNGNLDNDLAQSITISDDGLTYNVILRQDKFFSDNTPVKAEDVAYTIAMIQNPDIKSPLRGNWSGVSVEVVNEYEVNFVLDKAYTPFIENLTVGILPKHIWSNLTPDEFPFSQHNTEPIGSGPYKVVNVERDDSGLINEYQLKSTKEESHITDITLRFYQNESSVETALKEKEINATTALSEKTLTKFDNENWQVSETILPRVFSLFFNQNRSAAMRDSAARKALDAAINRDELINKVLSGYGEIATSPIPSGFSNQNTDSSEDNINGQEAAKQILVDGGWTQSADGHWEKEIDGSNTRLSITIRTANTPVFEDTASYLVEVWHALGVDVNVELYDQTDLVQSVIRPRDYQALLFGIDVGRPLDLYPFWHSSQREDPGLNVALYANITTDRLLEKIRTEQDETIKAGELNDFISEIQNDHPAIFLFDPAFTYLSATNIHPEVMNKLAKPSERFSNISNWYIEEDKVWPIFQ